jgi:hypothetical protein
LIMNCNWAIRQKCPRVRSRCRAYVVLWAHKCDDMSIVRCCIFYFRIHSCEILPILRHIKFSTREAAIFASWWFFYTCFFWTFPCLVIFNNNVLVELGRHDQMQTLFRKFQKICNLVNRIGYSAVCPWRLSKTMASSMRLLLNFAISRGHCSENKAVNSVDTKPTIESNILCRHLNLFWRLCTVEAFWMKKDIANETNWHTWKSLWILVDKKSGHAENTSSA